MANSGKIAEVLFEQQLETYEEQNQLITQADVFTPDPGQMQNAGNFIWRTKQQHAPIIEGWDLSGKEQDIIEETYPAILGTPKNDFVKQRVDQNRDMGFWERRGRASGVQQATELNKSIANLIATQGSLFYRNNDANGLEFISEGQVILNERQGAKTERCFILNDRDTRKYATELSGRQTIAGKPEEAWLTGQIGSNIAEFEIFTGSYLPNLKGGAGSTTTTAAASFKPEGGSVDQSTGIVTNIDYRRADIAVTASGGFNIGDKVSIANSGETIKAVGLSDKTETVQDMTFTVVGKPNGTTLTIYPKPIALNDATLNETELAYANVDKTITDGATVTRLNTDASARTNLFFDRDAIEVVGGDVPMELLGDLDGMKVVSEQLSNGLNMYMIYDAELTGLTLRYRTFVWYGLTMKDPSRAGVAVTY